jgi:sulfatase modifying factor 1
MIPPEDPHAVPPRTIALIVAVVLGGVVLGTLVTMRHDRPGRLRQQSGIVNPETPPAAVIAPAAGDTGTNGMMWIPGGTFAMGSDDAQSKSDERPVHNVTLEGFWMDRTEVTNAEFERFVRATGYRTVAERPPDPKAFPDAPPEMLVPGSIVFSPPPGEVSLENHYAWWRWVPGASWRTPEGPGSTNRGRENHPVVHVAWDDAVAYAKWAGKRLPTEAEWEVAARGGLAGKRYTWGDELTPGGQWQCNIWQGQFPNENAKLDNFHATAPVGLYPANGHGLRDMAGNVWEWCADWYLPDYYARSPAANPPGPDTSHDPNEPGAWKRVTRGGSFLCSDLYCIGYRPSARMKCTPDTGLSHTGFRCVRGK